MKIRFQADADLNQIIVSATARREPSIDFQSAAAVNLTSLHDREVLQIAARQGRILVTQRTITKPCLGISQNLSLKRQVRDYW